MIFYSYIVKRCSCLIDIHTMLNCCSSINSTIKDQIVDRDICTILYINHARCAINFLSRDGFAIAINRDIFTLDRQDTIIISFASCVNDSIFHQGNNIAILRGSNSIFQGSIWSCTNKSFNLISCGIFNRSTVDGRIYHCNISTFASNITIENGKIPVSICVAYSTSNITVIHQNTSARAVGNIPGNSGILNAHITNRLVNNITIHSTIVEVKIGITTVGSWFVGG